MVCCLGSRGTISHVTQEASPFFERSGSRAVCFRFLSLAARLRTRRLLMKNKKLHSLRSQELLQAKLELAQIVGTLEKVGGRGENFRDVLLYTSSRKQSVGIAPPGASASRFFSWLMAVLLSASSAARDLFQDEAVKVTGWAFPS